MDELRYRSVGFRCSVDGASYRVCGERGPSQQGGTHMAMLSAHQPPHNVSSEISRAKPMIPTFVFIGVP